MLVVVQQQGIDEKDAPKARPGFWYGKWRERGNVVKGKLEGYTTRKLRNSQQRLAVIMR